MSSSQPCSTGESTLDEVLAVYLKAVDRGEAPDRAALLSRYPQWQAELGAFFAGQEKIDRWTEPLRELCTAPSTVNDQLTLPASQASSTDTAKPRTFGDYELLAEIAQGGMGVVYRARHRQLDRVVALKTIRTGQLASAIEVQRFQIGAQPAARLDHPHIVPIYEVGQAEGQHFFAMRLIDGYNLAQTVASGQWTASSKQDQERAAALLIKAARAVHYAHQHGILHRDLKPANILLDDQGEPHVTDFGLAKQI